jgi:hypothetical protein
MLHVRQGLRDRGLVRPHAHRWGGGGGPSATRRGRVGVDLSEREHLVEMRSGGRAAGEWGAVRVTD